MVLSVITTQTSVAAPTTGETTGAVDDFYDELMARGVSLLRRGQPGLTEQSAREIVHLSTMITEGASVLYGTRPGRAVDLGAVTGIAADLLGRLVREKATSETSSR